MQSLPPRNSSTPRKSYSQVAPHHLLHHTYAWHSNKLIFPDHPPPLAKAASSHQWRIRSYERSKKTVSSIRSIFPKYCQTWSRFASNGNLINQKALKFGGYGAVNRHHSCWGQWIRTITNCSRDSRPAIRRAPNSSGRYSTMPDIFRLGLRIDMYSLLY